MPIVLVLPLLETVIAVAASALAARAVSDAYDKLTS